MVLEVPSGGAAATGRPCPSSNCWPPSRLRFGLSFVGAGIRVSAVVPGRAWTHNSWPWARLESLERSRPPAGERSTYDRAGAPAGPGDGPPSLPSQNRMLWVACGFDPVNTRLTQTAPGGRPGDTGTAEARGSPQPSRGLLNRCRRAAHGRLALAQAQARQHATEPAKTSSGVCVEPCDDGPGRRSTRRGNEAMICTLLTLTPTTASDRYMIVQSDRIAPSIPRAGFS